MRTWLPILTLSSISAAALPALESEFAIVQDSDGYANVRKSASLKAEVVAKVNHGSLVWVWEEDQGGWHSIAFVQKDGREGYGFIHTSRLKPLATLAEIPAAGEVEGQRIEFKKGELHVEIEEEKFERGWVSVTIVHHPDGREDVIEIDRRPVWGTDGGMPRTKYGTISVRMGKQTLTLPKEAVADLFEPNLDMSEVFHDRKTGTLYITALNSDGAGAYAVAFKVVNGKYAGRRVLIPF